MPNHNTQQLIDLAEQKVDCLEQLRDYGHRQAMHIENGETTDLLKVLAVKQQLIGRLQEIERALDPYRGQEPAERRWRAPEDRARCAALIDRAESLLREIVAQEQNSEIELRRRRDVVATQLQGLNGLGQARAAYSADAGLRAAGGLNLCSEG